MNFLMKLGREIRRPVKIDHATDFSIRGKFARLYVEVNLTKPLVPRFKLKHRWRMIVYEGMRIVCFNYGIYGHNKDSCKVLEKKVTEEGKHEISAGNDGGTGETRKKPNYGDENLGSYGPWMILERQPIKYVKKKERGGPKDMDEEGRKVDKENVHGQYGKFDALTNMEEGNSHVEIKTDILVNEVVERRPIVEKLGSKARRPNVQVNEKEILRLESGPKVAKETSQGWSGPKGLSQPSQVNAENGTQRKVKPEVERFERRV